MALIDGLVSYHKLDENAANTTVVDSHGSNTGIASTNTSNLSSTGKINTAFDFNGSNEVVDITNFTNSQELITVGGWVNLGKTSRNDLGGLWEPSGQHQHILIAGLTSGKFQFFTSNNGTSANSSGVSTTTFVTGTWYHVMGTYDGIRIRIFVNGSEENSAGNTNGLHNASTSDNSIGASSTGIWTDGKIDEWGVWDRALSEAEITELYNSGDGLAYPFEVPIATLRQIKVAGTFVEKPILTKVSGTFVDKPIKIKVGGTFQ